MEPIPARLLARAKVPGLNGLALGYNTFRWSEGVAGCRVVTRDEQHVSVYDLRGLLEGAGPVAQIAHRVPAGRIVAPSPDGSFVVVCDQRELRAVNADGSVRWRLEHPCWVCADMVDHSSEPACGGGEGGSAYVSADGTLVWAHVITAWDDEAETGEAWLVLDAATGTVLGSAGLGAGTAGSGHLLHPDGRQAVLSIGYGQDGAAAYLGTWDDTALALAGFDMDRIAVDLDPAGHRVLTTPHSDEQLALYQLPDLRRLVELAATDMPHGGDENRSAGWDYAAAFVDTGTIIAVLDTYDGGHVRAHWLMDCGRGPGSVGPVGPIGPIAYPVVSAADMTGLVTLGDGTWVTIDTDDVLMRWTRARTDP